MMTKKGLKNLKRKLPRGYVKRAVEETGMSSITVYRTIKGTKVNLKVLDALIRIANEHQASINCQNDKLKSI